MAKVRRVERGGELVGLRFNCPGCGRKHVTWIKGEKAWQWNGSFDAPTFSPSILVRIEWSKSMEPGDNPEEWKDEICHSFVTDGKIRFLGDCTHALANQIIDLPDDY